MSTVILRQVEGDTVVHRLWAGTKLVSVFAISVLLMFLPSWPVLGLVALFLIGSMTLARVPIGALPRLPWWFWAMLVAGGLINVPVGTAAVLRYLQVTVFGLLLIAASMVIAWTTPLNQIAPAVATLGAPLRRLRLPVDEWAVAIALCLRSLPLLLDEIRMLNASRRLRPKNNSGGRAHDHQLIDIITAAMSVSMRRATELGEAITARGGAGQLTAHPSRPGLADVIALAAVLVLCAGGVGISLVL